MPYGTRLAVVRKSRDLRDIDLRLYPARGTLGPSTNGSPTQVLPGVRCGGTECTAGRIKSEINVSEISRLAHNCQPCAIRHTTSLRVFPTAPHWKKDCKSEAIKLRAGGGQSGELLQFCLKHGQVLVFFGSHLSAQFVFC